MEFINGKEPWKEKEPDNELKCSECGNWHYIDYGVIIKDQFYCNDCLHECEHCGHHYHESQIVWEYRIPFCPNCDKPESE
jgi:formylmethanofuran dehydrogenase subunit E